VSVRLVDGDGNAISSVMLFDRHAEHRLSGEVDGLSARRGYAAAECMS